MKATSISIKLSAGCNANCPFCISKTTFKPNKKYTDCPKDNLIKGLSFAEYNKVDTVLITSDGEPLTRFAAVGETLSLINRAFRFPVKELQTNGSLLTDEILDYYTPILNVISISAADIDPAKSNEIMKMKRLSFEEAIKLIKNHPRARNLMIRLSLNMTNQFSVDKLPTFVDYLVDLGVHQLTLRTLGKPTQPDKYPKITKWIEENSISQEETYNIIRLIAKEGIAVRPIDYNPDQWVYDYRGIGVTVASCWSAPIRGSEIRSLIIQPDGGLYTSWTERGSRII